jgi:hypothetical protein
MKTAYATIKGFEVMRMFKKGQFIPWIDAIVEPRRASSTAYSAFIATDAIRPSRDATGARHFSKSSHCVSWLRPDRTIRSTQARETEASGVMDCRVGTAALTTILNGM